jgi:PDZ domain-containing protein
VGHNVGVSRFAPILSRARATVRRYVDDMQFARPRLALTSLGLLCAMIVGGALIPVPYVIEQPGPAIDVLGDYEDEQILVIDGAETYETDGSLMLTTVSVDGGPGYTVTPSQVVYSWFNRSHSVLPREVMFPEDQTAEQTALNNAVQMSTSQQGAVAVALDELGIDYEPAVLIGGVLEDAPADGILEPGDVLVSVGGETANDVIGYQELVGATPEGQDVPLTVRRDGEELELEVPAEMVDGAPRMGVMLAEGYEFPMQVDLTVGSIGGPSAGLMFSLSVYDQLTPDALTGGHEIAGTGTIDVDADGAVGPIGGIRQKLTGASRAGAEFFLAPGDNCDEVVGYEPDGLDVVAVDTFEDAVTAVETIAETGSTEGLPTCEER